MQVDFVALRIKYNEADHTISIIQPVMCEGDVEIVFPLHQSREIRAALSYVEKTAYK